MLTGSMGRGLGRPSVYYWFLMAGQVLFVMAICYINRSFAALDRRKIAVRTFPVANNESY